MDTDDENLSIDFRTGLPTAITGKETGESQRAACAALNRKRARGIRKAAQGDAPWQPLSAHVWQTTFERKVSGALGKKLNLEREEESEFQIELSDADLNHTLDKLSVLNLVGGDPTEIVGLAETGDFLIAKKPLAFEFEDYHQDLKKSIMRMKGIFPRQCHFRKEVVVVWCEGEPWFVGDLHRRNIMRDGNSRPCVIDALIGEITPMALQLIPWLRKAVEDAKQFSETGKKPTYDLFDEIDDSEL